MEWSAPQRAYLGGTKDVSKRNKIWGKKKNHLSSNSMEKKDRYGPRRQDTATNKSRQMPCISHCGARCQRHHHHQSSWDGVHRGKIRGGGVEGKRKGYGMVSKLVGGGRERVRVKSFERKWKR